MRLKLEQGIAQRRVRVIGAVAYDDETRERNVRKLFGASGERASEVGPCPGEAERRGIVQAVRRFREAEKTEHELVGERFRERAPLRTKGLLNETAARRALDIRDLHAA